MPLEDARRGVGASARVRTEGDTGVPPAAAHRVVLPQRAVARVNVVVGCNSFRSKLWSWSWPSCRMTE